MLDMAPASHSNTSGDILYTLWPSKELPQRSFSRPLSEATEIFDTDAEDDESIFEENSPKGSFDSRRSQTTVSSYEEALTPRSDIRFEQKLPLGPQVKPVEGPKGPHLFRSSQSSAEFAFDYALQMSPLLPQAMELPVKINALSSRDYSAPGIDSAISSFQSHDIHQWSTGDVLDWMINSGLPVEVIDRFEKHDINGAVLMELEFENLKELEIESFGKRHQLWNAIQNLRGDERGPSPVPTPFQDISRPPTGVRSKSDGDISRENLPNLPHDASPDSPARRKKRRGRKNRHHDDMITPAESVSIVAIEQLLPKPHKCNKGENCSKWRKQQKILARIQQEQGWPVSPEHGGHIILSGDPGNAATAQKVLPDVHLLREGQYYQDEQLRPVSENIPPSVVASSDLLGPGQLPAFALHENMLSRLQMRDPQENVKQFLSFQHVGTPPAETPPTPPLDRSPAENYQMFPPAHQQAYPSLQRPDNTQSPHENLKSLPKLAIPRSASANPSFGRPNQVFSPAETTFSPCRSATASPGVANIRRFGTPASEMDVPVTAIPVGPICRDTSQSVPPNMQYREHTRVDWRRPSFQLPALDEDAVFSPTTAIPRSPNPLHVVDKAKQKEMKKAHAQATYGGTVAHAGYMKKRKNKLLRHEWQDAHFRLHGTQLNMHENNRLSAVMLDSIDVDEYSVACCNMPSNNKITAALKSLKLGDKKKDADAAAAFAFQLVPSDKDRAKMVQGKTHHFAVTNSDERIDWMRDLMLAKALRQKQSGFVVEHNGEKA